MNADVFDMLRELIINNGSEFEESIGEKIVDTKIKPNKRDLARATMYGEKKMTMVYQIDAWHENNEPCDEWINISCDLDSRDTECIEIRRVDGKIEIDTYGFNKKSEL